MINYIINLDRRKDRWDECIKRIDKSVELKKEKFIRISAFDGYNYEEELKRYNLKDNVLIKYLINNKVKVRKGLFGCFISHLIVLYNILQNENIKDDDYVGIYEDDFMYSENFDSKYKKLKKINLKELDIEFLYIGGRFEPDFDGAFMNLFEKTDNKNIYYRKDKFYGEYVWDRCATAYVINKKICKKLIKLLTINFVDNIFKATAVDELYKTFYKDIKMFDYFPHLYYSPLNYKTDIQDNNEIIEF